MRCRPGPQFRFHGNAMTNVSSVTRSLGSFMVDVGFLFGRKSILITPPPPKKNVWFLCSWCVLKTTQNHPPKQTHRNVPWANIATPFVDFRRPPYWKFGLLEVPPKLTVDDSKRWTAPLSSQKARRTNRRRWYRRMFWRPNWPPSASAGAWSCRLENKHHM